jgi:hypothetical protein
MDQQIGGELRYGCDEASTGNAMLVEASGKWREAGRKQAWSALPAAVRLRDNAIKMIFRLATRRDKAI